MWRRPSAPGYRRSGLRASGSRPATKTWVPGNRRWSKLLSASWSTRLSCRAAHCPAQVPTEPGSACTHTHTHTHTHAHTLPTAHTHTPYCAHTHSLLCAHTHTHSLLCAHTHTRTHSLLWYDYRLCSVIVLEYKHSFMAFSVNCSVNYLGGKKNRTGFGFEGQISVSEARTVQTRSR